MMQSYCEIMSQRHEQEAILLQEQAAQKKQELLAEEQAANPSEPSPVSYFYNADYDNISTPSTTYTIHLTKSATIITNPSEPTLCIYHNHYIFYDGDDDKELFPDEVKRIQQILEKTSFDAITPDFPITNSLSIGDEHLSTIPETKSDELIKSSVENLVPTPSESEDLSKNLSDIESECNVPVYDDFTTVFNPLFDADNDFSSSDDKSFSDEDFDSLLEEFSGEPAHIDLIPPGINEAEFDPEEDIHLVEKLLYDNSSPRPPEEFNSEYSDAIIESFSPSPIPVEDSDSLLEDIDLFLTPDDSMPPDIENDDYDSEWDILFLEELLSNDSPSLPGNESFNFDVPSSPRPPAKPSDNDEIKPDTGVLTAKVVGDISEHYVLMTRLLTTQPTLCPVIDTLLPFSSENEDKVHLLSHRGLKAFQLFSESPMMIYGGNISTLDVPYLHFYPPLPAQVWGIEISMDYEASRARGNGYSLNDKKEDKIEHGIGKGVKSQSQQVKDEAETEEILSGQPEAIILQEQAVEEKQELLAEEQAANPSEPSPVSYFYNADYDNISTSSTTYTIHLTKNEVKRIQQILERTSFDAITPDFPIMNSLSMGDEHLSTILETESDELIKSSVENLVPTPSESEDLSKDLPDIESECNVPVCDDFTTVSNPLFDADNDFSSSDDKSFSDEDIISSPKFDSLLEEFSGELAHVDLIPPGINEADFDPEEDIHLVKKLLYDNSSPRPLKEFNFEYSDAIIESFSPSPIPVEDSDSLMEEINLFLTLDDSMPSGIKNGDYDSEGDILFLKELLSNDSPSLPKNESFHFDVPSSPRPPAKPPDDDEIEPDTGVLTAKVVGDISEHYVLMPRLLPTQPTLCPDWPDFEASRARGFRSYVSLELQS
ncbi:hypothetical protein Tco_0988758 [Tanacetum coccineum]|uniref:Uncharacterized protein n=1 Tax=Tanacetum coccineum TaxID=301880 RepID=A0ABQ5ERZ0_9ASTR